MKPTRRDFLRLSLTAGGLAALSGIPGLAFGKKKDDKKKAAAPAGPKKVLILGGTSFLGPALVEAAQRRGFVLTLFNRGKTNPQLFPDIEKIHGDRKADLSGLKGRKWDAVIDTSGYLPGDVERAAMTLKDNVGQYVFISSISVYKEGPDPVDESSPIAEMPAEAPQDKFDIKYYGALKALCEQTAERIFPGHALNVRPGLIVGPGDPTDRYTYWPARLDRGGEVLAPGMPTDPVQIIDVRDLGEWVIAMVDKGQSGVYNAIGPKDRYTIGDLIGDCKTATGSNARLTWVPADFLEQQKVSGWTDLPVWIPSGTSESGLTQTSNVKAVAAGLTFRSTVDTAKDTLAWWKTLPEERRAKTRAGLKPEREAEVLAAWHAKESKPAPAVSAPKPLKGPVAPSKKGAQAQPGD